MIGLFILFMNLCPKASFLCAKKVQNISTLLAFSVPSFSTLHEPSALLIPLQRSYLKRCLYILPFLYFL